MQSIAAGLYIGNQSSCRPGSPELAVVHACKSPCHQRAVGYTGSLKRDHPHYLALSRPCDLYLNIIDPPVQLFQLDTFHHFLAFAAEQEAAARPLLIHCNQAESRAPTLALLYLAFLRRSIPRESFAQARAAFQSIYPAYNPGEGIQGFVSAHWDSVAPRKPPSQ